MKKLASILRLDFLPASADLGLLVLRLWLGASLLLLHGWGKFKDREKLFGTFPDPLGVGHQASYILALFGEVVFPILLIIGLFARFAALGSAITMAVAFFLVHKLVLKGPGSGEMAFIYLVGFITVLLAGPGRFAVDAKVSSVPRKPRPSKE
jgi:putative oxidoreductase